MGSIQNKLPEVMGRHRVKQAALAEAAGVRYATLNNVYNDKTRRIDFDTLASILDGLYILTGHQYTVADLLAYDPAVNETALLDASAADLADQLATIEEDVTPAEMAAWLAALESKPA